MNFWKNLSIIAILLGLATLFFLPNLLRGTIPYAGDFTGSDLTELNLPFRYFTSQELQNGHVPLWTDLLTSGFPLLAEGQSGVFYPANFFYMLFPFHSAITLSFIVNFFLAAVFTYMYCRALRISRLSSLLAAIAFSFSGFFIFRIKHVNIINAAVWLPLELYLIEKYFLGARKVLIGLGLSIVFALQFFAGHPQVTYISGLTCFAYFFLKTWQSGFYKEKKVIWQSLFFDYSLAVLPLGFRRSSSSLRSNYRGFRTDPE